MKNLLVIIGLLLVVGTPMGLKATTLNNSIKDVKVGGIYKDGIGTLYYVTQVGKKIYFAGENQKRNFAHVFSGVISGNTIRGTFYDVPKFAAKGRGKAIFKVTKNGTSIRMISGNFSKITMVKVSKSKVQSIFPTRRAAAWENITKLDLDGVWECNDGGKYYVRQFENVVVWFGESQFRKGGVPKFANVGIGKRKGDKVQIRLIDVPKGQLSNTGLFNIIVKDERNMKSSSSFHHWKRESPTSRKPNTRRDPKSDSKNPKPRSKSSTRTGRHIGNNNGTTSPPKTKKAKKPTSASKSNKNTLTVSYRGYTCDNVLWIRNVKGGKPQGQYIRNGKTVFNLQKNGGTYEICKDINPAKGDNLSPKLKVLRKVALKKGEHLNIIL